LLGAAVARRLQDRGDSVVLFQRSPGSSGFEHHLGDITDAAAATTVVAGVDAVIHMAARVGITGSWSDYERTNVDGTANVVAAAKAERVKRFVYVSSPSVAHAGEALVGVGAEPADPDRARGHYAKSKALAEQLALQASSPSFPVVALRPHLIWGPGDSQFVGRIVARARQGRLVTIGSGTALIDMTYVSNAADAIVAGLDRCDALEGRAFVISNSEPRPVAELVSRIVTAAGLAPPKVKVPYRVAQAGGLAAERVWDKTERDGDPPMTSFVAEQLATAHWFDQRETRRALDWEPAVSLDEGFSRLRDWFLEHPA
jgi:nucleoside-diphosphate-sugar epimerase